MGNGESNEIEVLLSKIPEALSLDNIKDVIKNKSWLICTDTCVLLNMVRLPKATPQTTVRIDKWLSQMNKCSELLMNKDISWIMTEQIHRELIQNIDSDTLHKTIKDMLLELALQNHTFSDRALLDISSILRDKCNAVSELAVQNRVHILEKTILLSESEIEFIHIAWSLVHDNNFPNSPKNQQMKDSAILSHLYEFINYLDEEKTRVLFWTFDKFDRNPPPAKFPTPEIQRNEGPAGKPKKQIDISDDIADFERIAMSPSELGG